MLIGFNNDVEFKGQMYHIQTEDHGIKDGQITAILFFSGQILDSKKISYLSDVEGIEDEEESKKIIKKHMVDLHREFYKRLFDGDYEERVAKLIKKGAAKVEIGETQGAPTEASAPAAEQSAPGIRDDAKDKPASSVRPIPPPIPKRMPSRPLAPRPVEPVEGRVVPVEQMPPREAFRGLSWPELDLRLDELVATFLESSA